MKRHLGPAIAAFILAFCGTAFAQGPCTVQNSNLACVIIDEYGLTPPGSPFTFLTQGHPDFENVLNPVGGHPTHFSTTTFANSLSALNTAIGTQANLLPLASPSSGILLSYDPSLKTFVASEDESLGPVLGERAETIGRHRLFLGFSYQYFNFDKIDGTSLQSIPVVLTHTPDPRDDCPTGTCSSTNNPQNACSTTGSSLGGCGFIRDRIDTQSSINLTESQYTAYVTFGLTRRIDVSAVIPFETINMSLTTQATIVPGTNGFFTPTPGSPDAGATSKPNNNQCTFTGGTTSCVSNGTPYFFHTFKNCPNTSPAGGPQSAPNYGLDQTCFNHTFPDPTFAGGVFGSSSPNNSASGIGDVTIRVKWNVWDGERAGIAAGLDVRFPSGNALNFLGSGAYGYKPFVVLSYRARVSPHVVIGYEWNTNSITAGDLINQPIGTSGGKVPNVFFYTAGADARVTRWLTGDFDIFGQRLFSGPIAQVTTQPFLGNCGACTGANPPSVPLQSLFLVPSASGNGGTAPTASYNVTYASPGIKVRPIPGVAKLVFSGSALIRLDSMGLVSRVAPLVGVGYTF